jgi:hypothetical protein
MAMILSSRNPSCEHDLGYRKRKKYILFMHKNMIKKIQEEIYILCVRKIHTIIMILYLMCIKLHAMQHSDFYIFLKGGKKLCLSLI